MHVLHNKITINNEPVLKTRKTTDQFFEPLRQTDPANFQLTDGTILLDVPSSRQLLTHNKTYLEDIHFPSHLSPQVLARQLFRLSVSGLAVIGARPLGYMITLAMPRKGQGDWEKQFCHGLLLEQKLHQCGFLDGSLHSFKKTTFVTFTIFGEINSNAFLTFHGAMPGDRLYVTGTIGDRLIGRRLLAEPPKGVLQADPQEYLQQRYLMPTPRIDVGASLIGVASACANTQNGLIAGAKNICQASKLKLHLKADAMPLSPALKKYLETFSREARQQIMLECLIHSNDCELLFALPPGEQEHIDFLIKRYNTPINLIGHFGPPTASDENETPYNVIVNSNGNMLNL